MAPLFCHQIGSLALQSDTVDVDETDGLVLRRNFFGKSDGAAHSGLLAVECNENQVVFQLGRLLLDQRSNPHHGRCARGVVQRRGEKLLPKDAAAVEVCAEDEGAFAFAAPADRSDILQRAL